MYRYCSVIKNSECSSNIRIKLSALGLKAGDNNTNSIFTCVKDGFFYGKENYLDISNLDNFVYSHNNENLFLAIAAIQNITDDKQYFVFDEDFKNHKKGEILYIDVASNFEEELLYMHKASLNELMITFLK